LEVKGDIDCSHNYSDRKN